MGKTLAGAVGLEVRNQFGGVGPDVAKVDSLATLAEEEHTIEDLEELGRRLREIYQLCGSSAIPTLCVPDEWYIK